MFLWKRCTNLCRSNRKQTDEKLSVHEKANHSQRLISRSHPWLNSPRILRRLHKQQRSPEHQTSCQSQMVCVETLITKTLEFYPEVPVLYTHHSVAGCLGSCYIFATRWPADPCLSFVYDLSIDDRKSWHWHVLCCVCYVCRISSSWWEEDNSCRLTHKL